MALENSHCCKGLGSVHAAGQQPQCPLPGGHTSSPCHSLLVSAASLLQQILSYRKNLPLHVPILSFGHRSSLTSSQLHYLSEGPSTWETVLYSAQKGTPRGGLKPADSDSDKSWGMSGAWRVTCNHAEETRYVRKEGKLDPTSPHTHTHTSQLR